MSDWKTRAPRSVTDDTDPYGTPITTSQDRRWLWRLELELSGPLSDALREYLHTTCEHHWVDRDAGPDLDDSECRQCLWCNVVEPGEAGAAA